MKKNFLLSSALSKKLYNRFAKKLPIIDYHNHLSLSDIKTEKRFTDIYDLWILPDPYKHRAMRMCGVPENLITGVTEKKDKFRVWCEIFPNLVGTPVYDWSKMELSVVFGINEIPSKENWQKIYDTANGFLAKENVTPSYLLKKFNVECVCPCAQITDDAKEICASKGVFPSLRADNVIKPDIKLIETLKVKSLTEFKSAVTERLKSFRSANCKYVDLALDDGFIYEEDDGKTDSRFLNLLSGKTLSKEDAIKLTSNLLVFICGEFDRLGLILQLHIGAERFTSSRLRVLAGAAGGFAGIGKGVDVVSLTRMLDDIEKVNGGLPKTILFTLNPSDNAVMSVLSGSYAKDGVEGLITQGPAWWWCDHKLGITEVLETSAVFGVLSNFVGMTTDSRSFLSLVRHDYFRRVLCNFIADKVKEKTYPKNFNELKNLIYRMCYGNAKKTLL